MCEVAVTIQGASSSSISIQVEALGIFDLYLDFEH